MGMAIFLALFGTLVIVLAMRSKYQPTPGAYVLLFFLFAGSTLIVGAVIPLLILYLATRHKPVVPDEVLSFYRKNCRHDDFGIKNDEIWIDDHSKIGADDDRPSDEIHIPGYID